MQSAWVVGGSQTTREVMAPFAKIDLGLPMVQGMRQWAIFSPNT